MRKPLPFLLGVAFVVVAFRVDAGGEPSDVAALRDEVRALATRVESLERRIGFGVPAPDEAPAGAPKPAEAPTLASLKPPSLLPPGGSTMAAVALGEWQTEYLGAGFADAHLIAMRRMLADTPATGDRSAARALVRQAEADAAAKLAACIAARDRYRALLAEGK